MKRVKSRNEAILDLIAPLIEKYVYKVPIQREAWGSLPYFWSHYSSWLFSKEFLENIFLRGKRRTNIDLIYQLGKPYLRISKLLACWKPARGDLDWNQERFQVMDGWNMVVLKWLSYLYRGHIFLWIFNAS